MDPTDPSGKRELALPPGSYAFVQDESKGPIRIYVGSIVINQTAQDRPVVYDPNTRKFRPVELHQAVRQQPVAGERDYIVLENPSENGEYPKENAAENAPSLLMGQKLNIPGPISFALYPGQEATVVPGHDLNSNEYLFVRVYNAEKARENWDEAMEEDTGIKKEELTLGKPLIITGPLFYIPPTGVEVLKDNEGNYVRQAVTLERMEFAILVDRDGNKRYERGEQVAFPKPTEEFFTKDGKRKFNAIELNEITGIHIKVISPYTEGEGEDAVSFKEGQELFITGKDTSIYFPKPQHSIVKYGEREKHFATAVPEGEGRYVMGRNDGIITTVKGPQMLLPDPRTDVIVRRILSDNEASLWYPGNEEALRYNRSLRQVAESDILSEQQVRSQRRTRGSTQKMFSATVEDYAAEEAGSGIVADEFTRKTQYTKPRTLTLDTKYECVPKIMPWTGYAVMIVGADGSRRVEIGPKTILLDYDETLEVLELSTGKPKNTDKLQRTVYLRIKNNKVSDIVGVETKDHAPISIKMSFRVDFGGEPTKWFDCENYVKLLTDHIRSMLKGTIRKIEVEEFYGNGEAIVRNIILGEKDEEGHRPLQTFEENGMIVKDVEILQIKIEDESISRMLSEHQRKTVEQNISLNRQEKDLIVTKRQEKIKQESNQARQETATLTSKLEIQRIEEGAEVTAANLKSILEKSETDKEIEAAREAIKEVGHKADLERRKQQAAQDQAEKTAEVESEIQLRESQTTAVMERFKAAQPGFSEAILALSNAETLEKIAKAHSVQTLIGGESVVDVLQKVFKGTSLENGLEQVTKGLASGLPAFRRSTITEE
jgi:major vault protein